MKTKWNVLLILALLAMLMGVVADPAHTQSAVYSIIGQVWFDGDQDGLWDDIEPPFNSMWVGLDPGCDDNLTPDLYFPLVSGGDGWFTFEDQPAGASYCVYGYGFWVEDFRVLSEPAPFLLTGDVTGKNIGVTSNWITLSDTGIPAGQYNEPYFYETTVWGGTGPFTLTGTYTMPAGMFYFLEGRILTLSGTPTQVGGFANGAKVVDAAGHEYTTLRFMVYGVAEFNLTSTPNPAALGQAVSFTFSASDPNFPDKPPYGLVTFYADETQIEGCTNVYLNVVVVEGQPALGDFPAVCQTDALAAGNHTIRADFVSYSPYHDASLTLTCGQTVGAAPSHCISGYVFYDDDGDGVLDTDFPPESYNSSAIIHLDQHCDGYDPADILDTWVYTVEGGLFTFTGLPDGETFCAAPDLDLGWEMTTAPIQFDALTADQTGLMIGVRHMQFVLNQAIPDYELGTAVDQSFTITGGQAPYTILPGEIELPTGLAWSFDDIDTLTLSGTPQMAGDFFFSAWLTDANGVEDELQVTFMVRTDADMTLISSPDSPSSSGEPVTFTFTANRPDLTWPDYLSPTGTVTFTADDVAIAESCTNIPIYFVWVETDPETGDGYYEYHNTATCTATLADGSHEISAVFANNDERSPYHDATLTLTQIVLSPGFTISGAVFNDLSGDGVWDLDESGLEGAYVNFDLGCDGEVDFPMSVNTDGSYLLENVPSGFCIAVSGEYSSGFTNVGWKETTLPVQFASLDADQSGVNIGLQEYSLTYSPAFPDGLPDGQLNQPYNQAITVSGGVLPYAFSRYGSEGNLPANGLEVSTIDPNTGVITISGTPTAAGEYSLDIYISDANGLEREVQGSFFIKTDAVFNLTSSANPSNLGEPVTFSLSANGNVGPYAPNGPVTFKADGVLIAGCEQLILGYDEIGTYTNPVQCTTSALAAGSHVITADFTPGWGPYNDATVTLSGGQVVTSAEAADLKLTKTDSKDPVKPGAQLVYTLTVSNLGLNAAESVVLSDKLDSNTTYVSTSAPKGWKCSYSANSATVTCTSASLASGSSAVIKITVTVNKTARPGKELVNTAQVSSATSDPNMANNTITQKTMVAK